jgi:hypothetical protein
MAWYSAQIAREKVNYQKNLMALLSAQHVGAVGRLEKKKTPLKKIENNRNIIESGKLEIYTCTLVK